MPRVLLTIVGQLSTRVVIAAVLGAVGLLAGPWLASIHVSWLRDWSPIAVVYALTAPVMPLLFGSLLVPILGYAYLASRQVQFQIGTTDEENGKRDDGAG